MGTGSRQLAAALVITAGAATMLPGTAGAQEFGYKYTASLNDPSMDAIALLAEGYRPANNLNYLDECRASNVGRYNDATFRALAIDECMTNTATRKDVQAAMKTTAPWLAGGGLLAAFGMAAMRRRQNKPNPMATHVKQPRRRMGNSM